MKTFLKYSGIIAAIVAAVSFVLLMTTAGLQYVADSNTYSVAGSTVIFGAKETVQMSLPVVGTVSLGEVSLAPSANALIAFILGAIGLVALIFGALLPVLKKKALEKFAGLINLVALVALVVAGIMIFAAQPTFAEANKFKVGMATVSVYKDFTLTFTWVLSGILLIASGALAIFPAAMDFFGGKKAKKKSKK